MCNMHVYIVINTAFIYDFKKDLCSLVLKKKDIVIDLKLYKPSCEIRMKMCIPCSKLNRVIFL